MSLRSDDGGNVKHFVRLSNGEVLCVEEAETELIMGRHLSNDGVQVWVCSINEFGVQAFGYASEDADALVGGLHGTAKEKQDES